jgi:hypothetical protein
MERRIYPRVKTCNLISYMAIRKNGEITDLGMGRALNLSQNGIFLETPRLLFSEYVSLMSVDLDNNLIEIKGQVMYSEANGSGMVGNGIRLQGEHHENIQFATKLIKVFHVRKNRYAPAVMI